NPGAITGFVAVSIGYWLANAAGMWVLAEGCGLALTPFEAIATLAIMNLALLIPGGPAQLGVFQTGVAAALHLFVPSDTVMNAGSTFVFYLYVCQLGTIVLLGLGSQWSLKLDWRAALRLPRTEASG
ncbi:MAG: flippase-like domain-containing protein, partial [Nannocystaceae bacterium]|nr:flippase-like domain-containing protein [Nannocystaceae bacterium]